MTNVMLAFIIGCAMGNSEPLTLEQRHQLGEIILIGLASVPFILSAALFYGWRESRKAAGKAPTGNRGTK